MKQFAIGLSTCIAFALTAPAGCAARYTSTAYLSVTPINDPDRHGNVAADLNALKEFYVRFATEHAVLRRAVDDDAAQDGMKLDRIRKTSWFTGDSDETVKLLRDRLDIAGIEKTNLIRLSLRGPNPRQLPQVVNAVADAMVYQAAKQVQQKRAAKKETAFARLKEIHGQILGKRKAIAQIRGRAEISHMRERRMIIQLTLQSLTTELTQLRLVKAQAQKALAGLKKRAKSGQLAKSPKVRRAVEQDPTYRKLVTAVENIKIELGSLRDRLGPPVSLDATQARLKLLEAKRDEIKGLLVD